MDSIEVDMTAGRPSKYTEELLKKAEDYLLNYHSKHGDIIPSISGLSLVLNVSRETVHAWGRDGKKPEFSDILEKINAKQEKELINGGLSGEMNANITKLVLGKHGYSDKQETKGTLDVNLKDLSDEELEELANGSS